MLKIRPVQHVIRQTLDRKRVIVDERLRQKFVIVTPAAMDGDTFNRISDEVVAKLDQVCMYMQQTAILYLLMSLTLDRDVLLSCQWHKPVGYWQRGCDCGSPAGMAATAALCMLWSDAGVVAARPDATLVRILLSPMI